jgi:diguanylate cyclase (GGDEF)-like protein
MRLFRSSTSLLSLGLACLTLALVLMAHSLGIASDDSGPLVRARIQTAELVAAQCAAAAAVKDTSTMTTLVREVAARNGDVASVGLRDAAGRLIADAGGHEAAWADAGPRASATAMRVRVPVHAPGGEWGAVEFTFRRHGAHTSAVPPMVARLIANPALRVGAFVAAAGFVCYSVYLRRTLRHLDPTSVIPPRVRMMLDALAEGVVVLDRTGRVVLANASFSSRTRLPLPLLQGRSLGELPWKPLRGDGPQSDIAPWAKVLSEGTPVHGVPLALRVDAADAPERTFMVNTAPILGPDQKVRGALATFDDVTQLEQANQMLTQSRDEIQRQNEQLQVLATTDPLTGCLNRRSFLEHFESHWRARAGRRGEVLACVMLDVDRFKSINDRFGHAGGDRVLRDVANVLLESLSPGQFVCRYGGEEFCLLLPGTSASAAADVAEHMRGAIRALETVTAVSASFGVASSEHPAADVKEMLDRADRALYTAKRMGRDRVCRWGDAPAAAVPEPIEQLPISSSVLDGISLSLALLKDHGMRSSFLALTSALAHRNRATAVHSRRVGDLCLLAAPGLLSPEEASELEIAALLHDIGKIGVPDAILLKPGPLTADEWEIMRRHDHIGVDMVIAAGMPLPVTWIVAAHHAMYRGEPDQRQPAPPSRRPPSAQPPAAATNIPMAARLLSVADAYDAMTNDRPYRKAMSRAAALAELRRCAGTQFDPGVVEHFIEVLLRQPDHTRAAA